MPDVPDIRRCRLGSAKLLDDLTCGRPPEQGFDTAGVKHDLIGIDVRKVFGPLKTRAPSPLY